MMALHHHNIQIRKTHNIHQIFFLNFQILTTLENYVVTLFNKLTCYKPATRDNITIQKHIYFVCCCLLKAHSLLSDILHIQIMDAIQT